MIMAAEMVVFAAELGAVSSGAAEKEPTVLLAMDKLKFRIVEDPAKPVEPLPLSVPSNYQIEIPVSTGYPLRLTFQVQGKSLEALRREIKERFDAEYYQNATVELVLLDRAAKGGKVLIYGAVRSNMVELPAGEPKTILEAVLQAAASEFAKLTKVKLHRLNPATGKVESRIVDVEAIKKSGDRSKDVVLQDGDRIEIPERGLVF